MHCYVKSECPLILSKSRILGHTQNLVFSELWFVGSYYRLNKHDVRDCFIPNTAEILKKKSVSRTEKEIVIQTLPS